MPPVRKREPYRSYLNHATLPVSTTAWRYRNPMFKAVAVDNIDHGWQKDDPDYPHTPEGIDNDSSVDASSSTDGVSTSQGSDVGSLSPTSFLFEGDLDVGSKIGDQNEELDAADNISMHSDASSDRSESDPHHPDDEHMIENFSDQEVIDETEDEVPPFVFDKNSMEKAQPLYKGCRLTNEESDVLLMSFIIRWGLDEKSIEDLLQLLDCHLPYPVMVPKYCFLKKFPLPEQIKIHYTCPHCCKLLPSGLNDIKCEICGITSNKKELRRNGNFFVQLSITEQVREVLQNNTLAPLLRQECEEKDVISGRFYRHLRETRIIGERDLSLQWHSDSISPSENTRMQAWLLLACINELPYHARRENMLLCGLYFGREKPHINSFLTPFVEELQFLHTEGFQFVSQTEQCNVKVHTILSTMSSVARPDVQGIKQYYGSYGCAYCLSRGDYIKTHTGRGWVYPAGKGQPRTVEQHINALHELQKYNAQNRVKKSHIEGVKSQSMLLVLSVFNIIHSFVPDYLHSILEGVVLVFLKHWTDGNHEGRDWYLNKRKCILLSERLKNIVPPSELTRLPQGLNNVKLFKASQLRHFLLYYSLVCLKGILPTKYLKHWFLLVHGMTVYLREKFSRQEALTAKAAINKFVLMISTLYPNSIYLYTIEVHLLLHIPKAVENFGGLWASSTFPYEHFNGLIAKLISGTRTNPEHICRSVFRLRQLLHAGVKIFMRSNHSVDGRILFEKLISKYQQSEHSYDFSNDVRLFGSPEMYKMSLAEKVAVKRALANVEVNVTAHSFKRLTYKGSVYHASACEPLNKRDNSTVKMVDGKIIYIHQILVVEVSNGAEKKCVFLGEEFDNLNETLCDDKELNLSSSNLLHVCSRTGRIVSGTPHNFAIKCVQISYGNAVCIVPLVNNLERD